MTTVNEVKQSIYTYSYTKEERFICKLEMRAFFGFDSESNILETSVQVDPSRSPFMKERLDVLAEGSSIEEIIKKTEHIIFKEKTIKVVFIKNPSGESRSFSDRRDIEREVGFYLQGDVDLKEPEQLLGIMNLNGKWLFGALFLSESVWFKHQQKPYEYSTALSTRMARSVVNIAVPDPVGLKVIDPCCGIGTVLIEASSMGIDIVGSDMNPKVMYGSQKNLAHFGYETTPVNLADMRKISGDYDVAIIDMPYNLCSVITEEEQLEMFESARSFAKKVLVVTIDPVDKFISQAGFTIVDRCIATKNKTFFREVLVCE
ncbi:RNA methyltransferase [Salipaludibacillus neizhouensis]|uniref:RNA methyltransferase n=1 Tax=Salipaludibacillus neizhouensis TaxID=885475 RepID=A0A3A9K6H8_9BACI|nr:RNA methyltransferase [Salipaludibacillus neizhouensis]